MILKGLPDGGFVVAAAKPGTAAKPLASVAPISNCRRAGLCVNVRSFFMMSPVFGVTKGHFHTLLAGLFDG